VTMNEDDASAETRPKVGRAPTSVPSDTPASSIRCGRQRHPLRRHR